MPVSVPEAMPELERVGLRPVMAHTEKGAAYMADGFAGQRARSAAAPESAAPNRWVR